MDHRHETWVERQIRAAQERGDFDNLPGAGKPLPFLDEPDDPNWWVKGLMRRERIDTSALLPPQLALRKEAERLPDAVLGERTEQAVRDRVEDFNARVRECWRRPTTGLVVVVRTVDVDAMVARWRAQHPAEPTTESAQPTARPPRLRLRLLGRLRQARRRPHDADHARPSTADVLARAARRGGRLGFADAVDAVRAGRTSREDRHR